MDTPIFYVALFVHLVSLIVGFGSVLVIDTFGLLWLTKRINLQTVVNTANVTEKLIWLGLCGLIASGLVLIISKGYVDNLTQLKLAAVVMLAVNGVFLHHIKNSMEQFIAKNEIPNIVKFRMGLASTISQLGWWSAVSIGFLHRHWRHDIPYPKNPVMYMAVVAILIAVAALVGENVLRRKTNAK